MSADYDYLLREILPGKKFEALIPKSNCTKHDAGEGLTDHSIDVMAEVVEEYSWQMELVAAELKKSTLPETVNSIFEFCYDHFQYHADDEDQYLRSPACSWHDRYNGIDCKSYSILASSILTELGISHHIRKIKQPGEGSDNFTHVYVVIPTDQQRFDLEKGYYVIDGTVFDNREPIKLAKSDKFMSGLKHFVLNGPGLGSTPDQEPTGTGTTTQPSWTGTAITAGSNYVKANSKNWVKKISLKNISNLLHTPIGCWGGSAYSGERQEIDQNTFGQYCTSLITDANAALEVNNMVVFNQRICEFFTMVEVAGHVVQTKFTSQTWNPCTSKGIISMGELVTFYRDAVGHALEIWINDNFDDTPDGVRTYSSQNLMDKGVMPWCGFTSPPVTVSMTCWTAVRKRPSETVPPFAITDYVWSLAPAPQNFSPEAFISSFQELYHIVTNPGSIFTGNGNTTPTTPGTMIDPNTGAIVPISGSDKPQSKASMGIALALVAGAIAFGTMEFGKTPDKKPTKKIAA